MIIIIFTAAIFIIIALFIRYLFSAGSRQPIEGNRLGNPHLPGNRLNIPRPLNSAQRAPDWAHNPNNPANPLSPLNPMNPNNPARRAAAWAHSLNNPAKPQSPPNPMNPLNPMTPNNPNNTNNPINRNRNRR